MVYRFLLFCFFLLMSGCSTTLRPDLSLPAAEAGYPTAEFYAGGNLFHGLGSVVAARGSPLSDVNLEVQGYFSGVIRVDSAACGVSESVVYSNSSRVKITLPGVAVASCLLDILVSPSYPEKNNKTNERTYQFKGQLAVKVLGKQDPWIGYSTKLRADGDEPVIIDVGAPGQYHLVFRGCSSKYDEMLRTPSSTIKAQFKAVVPAKNKDPHCLLEGFIERVDKWSPPVRLSWQVWRYSSDFLPLPIPSVTAGSWGRVSVEGDPSVSVISLDDEYKVNYKAEFYFDDKAPHTLRVFTVKGRSAVCEYYFDSNEGWGWECLN